MADYGLKKISKRHELPQAAAPSLPAEPSAPQSPTAHDAATTDFKVLTWNVMG